MLRKIPLIVGLLLVAFGGLAQPTAAPPTAATTPATEMLPTPRVELPGTIAHHVDGDTLDVEFRFKVRIRLMADDKRGCWSPESRTKNPVEKKLGLAAKANLERISPIGSPCVVALPLWSDELKDYHTLERILATVRVRGVSLGEEQIRSKNASSTKGGKLGE